MTSVGYSKEQSLFSNWVAAIDIASKCSTVLDVRLEAGLSDRLAI